MILSPSLDRTVSFGGVCSTLLFTTPKKIIPTKSLETAWTEVLFLWFAHICADRSLLTSLNRKKDNPMHFHSWVILLEMMWFWRTAQQHPSHNQHNLFQFFGKICLLNLFIVTELINFISNWLIQHEYHIMRCTIFSKTI